MRVGGLGSSPHRFESPPGVRPACGWLFPPETVFDDRKLLPFLRAALNASARGVAPFVAAACRDPARFEEADHLCDSFLTTHVANQASGGQSSMGV